MSQLEVFSEHIKDLGDINLNLSKFIQKKKDSFKLLHNENKIPRSLRIKCELTSSPDFADSQVFLQLKEELQNEVESFIKKGTSIMTKWAQENIQLLIKQRCSKLFIVALQILDGLSSYNGDIIGTPNWPSAPTKHIPLFLLKIYFSNEYINTTKLTQYLEMSTEEILLLSTRIISNLQTDEEAKTLLDSFNLTEIDPEDPIESGFITETLDQFNSILTTTTIDLWSHHEKKTKANTAVNNLKNKMELLKAVTATTSTALAIDKAIENANTAQNSDRQSQLRLANLEKAQRRQEHKANEILNKLNDKKQKNLTGSRITESTTSPPNKTLTNSKAQKKLRIVDLTKERTEGTQTPLKRQSDGKIRKPQTIFRTTQCRFQT